MCMQGVSRYFHGESRRTKNLELDQKADPTSTKEFSVRIIHAGGLVERYQGTIHAGRVLEKYPNMCIARPNVFEQPHESIVEPDEFLLPGQKFYLVPNTTVRKLKRRHQRRLRKVEAVAESKGVVDDQKKVVGVEDQSYSDDSDDSGFSAKDFYVSGRSWQKRGIREKKPFAPPIKKASMWKGIGWQPSLDSVEELSP